MALLQPQWTESAPRARARTSRTLRQPRPQHFAGPRPYRPGPSGAPLTGGRIRHSAASAADRGVASSTYRSSRWPIRTRSFERRAARHFQAVDIHAVSAAQVAPAHRRRPRQTPHGDATATRRHRCDLAHGIPAHHHVGDEQQGALAPAVVDIELFATSLVFRHPPPERSRAVAHGRPLIG